MNKWSYLPDQPEQRAPLCQFSMEKVVTNARRAWRKLLELPGHHVESGSLCQFSIKEVIATARSARSNFSIQPGQHDESGRHSQVNMEAVIMMPVQHEESHTARSAWKMGS